MNEIICKTCKISKSSEEFYKSHLVCKKCTAERLRKSYLDNRERILKRAKAYYANNREKIDNYKKKYRETNKEELSRKQRILYEKDPMMWILPKAKQRAMKKGLEFSINKEDIIIPKYCPILGIELKSCGLGGGDSSPSIDRINPKKGYTKDNIQVISIRANRIKNDASIEELRKIATFLENLTNERTKMGIKLIPVNKLLVVEKQEVKKNDNNQLFLVPEKVVLYKNSIVTLKSAPEGSPYERYVGLNMLVLTAMIDEVSLNGTNHYMIPEHGVLAILTESELF